eukprot:gene31621-42163_t
MSMPALFKNRLSLPVIGSPLFIISVPALVIAQCKAGIVGAFPALNARPATLLDEWLSEIKEALAAHDKAHPDRLSAPFAVNQIVHKSNNRLEQDLAVCEKHKVSMMITSLGAREELNQAAHGWDGILAPQLDYRTRPCNFVEIMPRLDEHLRRPKAKGASRLEMMGDAALYPSCESQHQLPRLPDQVLPEAAMRLLRDQHEAGLLIDLACSAEIALGPQRDLAIAAALRERDAFAHQALPEPQAAAGGVHQQQPQLCDVVGVPDQEHRADRLAVAGGRSARHCAQPHQRVRLLRLRSGLCLSGPSRRGS